MTFPQIPVICRRNAVSLLAVVGLLLAFLPEPAEAKGKSKAKPAAATTAAASGDSFAGQEVAKTKTKTKSKSKSTTSKVSKAHHHNSPHGQSLAKGKAKSRRSTSSSRVTEIAPVVPDTATPATPPEVETKVVAPPPSETEHSDRGMANSDSSGRETRKDVEPAGTAGQATDTEEGEPTVVARKSAAMEARSQGGAPWTAYALGGVGLLGVGGYAALTWKGRQDNATLRTSCAPDCNPESVHHIRMVYLAADVSLGVGLVALAASTWLFVRSPSSEERASTRVAHINAVDLRATASGAFATLGGSF